MAKPSARKTKNIRPGLRARAVLIDHPYYTVEEVAEEAKCGIRTVSYQKSNLIREGIVDPAYFDHSPKARTLDLTRRRGLDTSIPLGTPESPEIENVVTEQEAGRLTTEESLDMLADFARKARDSRNFPLAKDAIVAYNKIESGTIETQLGPPPPQTDPEKVSRTTHILDVVGPTVAAKAVCQAFTQEMDRRSFEEEFARQSVTHPPTKETQTLILTGESSNDETNQSAESQEVDSGHAKDPPDSPSSLPISETT